MADIFISYAREDREVARRLAEALEQEELTVWWDSKILGGRSFRQAIHEEIDAATCVIVIWSTHSSVSRFVVDEAEEALAKQKPLVPVTVDGSTGAIGFRGYQVVDLSKWHEGGDGPGFQRLIESIRLAMGKPVEAEDLPVIMPAGSANAPEPVAAAGGNDEANGQLGVKVDTGSPPDKPRKIRALLWLLLALLVVGTGYGVYQYVESVKRAEIVTKRAEERRLRAKLVEAEGALARIDEQIRSYETDIKKALDAAKKASVAKQRASVGYDKATNRIDQLNRVANLNNLASVRHQLEGAKKAQAKYRETMAEQTRIEKDESQRAKDLDQKLRDALDRKKQVEMDVTKLKIELKKLSS